MLRFFLSFMLGAMGVVAAVKPDHIRNDPQANLFQVIKDPVQQKQFGAQMALYMQSLRPANAVNGKGSIRIRSRQTGRTSVPVNFRTLAVGGVLINEYSTNKGRLTVRAEFGKDTRYEWQSPDQPLKVLNGEEAMQSFVGADFWMADLGLEMLRWPNQNVVERKLRRGELCSVLVSRPAKVVEGGYSKVISWVDEDSMGIVRAEIFDAQGKLLKVFEPKAFRKIDGQWHLKEMEMRNEQTNSRTAIVFDLEVAKEK